MTRPGVEPWSPGPLVNTLTALPMSGKIIDIICIKNTIIDISGFKNTIIDAIIIGLVVKVFVNGPGERDSIPDRVIPKSQKWYLMLPCFTLSIISYMSKVKGAIQGKE